MSNLTAEYLIEEQNKTNALSLNRSMLILLAWISTLLLSKLPLVVARDLMGNDIPWIVPAWLGISALLFAATFVWQSLKPLRAYKRPWRKSVSKSWAPEQTWSLSPANSR